MKYVIMQNMFGAYWISKTELELPDDAKVFDDFEDAQNEAIALCDLYENRDKLEEIEEVEDKDEITDEKMFKWLA